MLTLEAWLSASALSSTSTRKTWHPQWWHQLSVASQGLKVRHKLKTNLVKRLYFWAVLLYRDCEFELCIFHNRFAYRLCFQTCAASIQVPCLAYYQRLIMIATPFLSRGSGFLFYHWGLLKSSTRINSWLGGYIHLNPGRSIFRPRLAELYCLRRLCCIQASS